MRYIHTFFLFFLYVLSCSDGFAQQNPQKYVIGHWSGGLGICLTSVLNHLFHCEQTQQIPVVFWGKNSPYYTSEGLNGSKNSWEYYFEPVSHLRYEKDDPINYYCLADTSGSFAYYKLSQEKRDLAHSLIQKYIKPNAVVRSKVDRFYKTYLENKKTIGIHIRGTDKKTEEEPVSASRMVRVALKYADENTQFLIATDEQKILNELIALLAGRTVVYYNCTRSQDGNPLHDTSHGRSRSQIAQNGEDVVVEMLLLSKCDIFLHTFSNVSAIPLYFNPSLEHVALR